MIISNNDIISKEYILLDWNVIQYLKKPRNICDEECKKLLKALHKRYAFPFCEAHLRDLAKNYSKSNKSLVDNDLFFLQQLSNSVVIATDDNYEEFHLTRYSPAKLFQEIINEDTVKPNISPETNPQLIFKVDMDLLDQAHPMRNMLEQTDGIYSPEIMSNWLNNLFEPLFNEIDDYKRFRTYLKKLKDDLQNFANTNTYDTLFKSLILKYAMPFINSLEIQDKNELASIWKEVITSWLHMDLPSIPFGTLITVAYNMLDLHPLFSEKLKKGKNTLSNITRDSKMIYYASSSKYFITEDKRCFEKATFIFKALNCNSRVIGIEQFVQKFS